MRENDEALAIQQAESLRCFAEDICFDINRRLEGCPAVIAHDEGLCYTLDFNTVDRFSVVLMGSETNNGDCFQSMIVLDGFSELLLSDRRPLDEFKGKLISLVCALAGNKVSISEIIEKHRKRYIEYRILNDCGEWETVCAEKKLGGIGAFLLLWKDSEKQIFCENILSWVCCDLVICTDDGSAGIHGSTACLCLYCAYIPNIFKAAYAIALPLNVDIAIKSPIFDLGLRRKLPKYPPAAALASSMSLLCVMPEVRI